MTWKPVCATLPTGGGKRDVDSGSRFASQKMELSVADRIKSDHAAVVKLSSDMNGREQKNRPLVSIGMPVYNGERYIRQAIESLLAQTYSNLELVISDNASTDSTLDVCREIARRDNRVTVMDSALNRGQIRNFRKAFHATTGKYFAWAGDHDLWHPEWVESHVEVFENHPEVVLAYPHAVSISPDGEEIPNNYVSFDTFGMSKRERIDAACRRMIGAGNRVYGMYRADVLRKTSVFPYFCGPDRLLLMELSVHGPFKQIDRKLWYRRYREGESAVASGIPDEYETLIQRYRRDLFDDEDGTPWHASFPVLSQVLGLILHLSFNPTDGSYRNMLWGPYMARIYFKRRKHFIRKEIQLALRRLFTGKTSGSGDTV